jgi:acyltransferase
MQEHTRRIPFIDIMRGVAVVVMVMGHSIDSVLSMDERTTEAFRLYDAVRGFTAPIFLFVAGFAFTIVTERNWLAYRAFSSRLRRRLWTVAGLFFVGYLLHLPFLSFQKLVIDTRPEEYAQLFQVDVLHCVAASMVILQILVFFARSQRTYGRNVWITTAVVVLGAPFVWMMDFAPYLGSFLAPYLNQSRASIFPIFPFSAFMLAGAGVAHHYLPAFAEGREKSFFRLLFRAAIVVGAAGVLFDLLPVSLYPSHDYWKTSPNFYLVRMCAVLLVTWAFFRIRNVPDRIRRPLLMLGQASLFVYIVHLMVVYGSAANIGLQTLVGRTLPYYYAALVAVAVLVVMIALTYARQYLKTHHEWRARALQAGVTSTIVYLFFTNPW